ncbi:methyltransferase family protein [Congregibacter sp.]|uniref:methyltransferase family protein n=1 Tax=Congregibacter sp. TaxID=2744308 RepID=UPI003F6C632C
MLWLLWTALPLLHLYLGMLLVLIAWGLYLGSGLSLFIAIVFAVCMTRFQIVPEERLMAQRFGDDFARYRRSVRRWL